MLQALDKQYTKEKVTLTLSPHLLKEVDRWSKEIKIKSRSSAIEKLIESWIEARKQHQLEAETEAYYLSMSDEEKKEDQEWAAFSSHQATGRGRRS